MSDIRKTFNFRTGVQVDDDVFIVRGSNVGIGTTIPTESLDIRGNTKVVGILTSTHVDFSAGISTFGDVKIGTGITVNASSGIITANKFVGNGSLLTNLPTSPWTQYNQTYNGATVVSISKNLGHVGVGTTNASSNFQVGANPYDNVSLGVGISSVGNARFSGVVTATSFVGDLTGGISNLIASGVSTFTDDVTFTGASANAVWDKSDNRLEFANNVKATFGTGIDLEIYSVGSGSESRILGTSGIPLRIGGDASNPTTVSINPVFADKGIVVKPNDSVELYFDGNQRFNTTGYGVSVGGFESIGIATFHSNVDVNANADISGNLVASVIGIGTGSNSGLGTLPFIQHNYDPTANVLALFESGDEAALICFQDNNSTTYNGKTPNTQVWCGNRGNDFRIGAGGLERVRVDQDGKTGIGSEAPRTHLEVVGITSTVELNVVGLSTFAEQIGGTSINVSGIVTASSFVGDVTGDLTGDVTGDLTGNVTGNTSGTAGGLTGTPDITVDDIIATKVGVNTATAAKQLHVYDDSNDVIRVNSNKDGAYVSFVDETGNWQPYVGGRGNDISFGNLTNGEKVRITGIGGSIGIGITIPHRELHVVGMSTVSDTAYFGGAVNIRGAINAPDSTLNVGSLAVESINAFNIGNKARMHSTVGITTLNKLYTTGIATFMDNVSVGTTSHLRPFVVNDALTARFSISNAGFVGIGTDSSGLPSGVQLTVNKNAIVKRGIGIGDTDIIQSLVDFSYVGAGFTGDNAIAYMLPPKNDQTGINAFSRIGGGTTLPGALVYNVTTNKLQCWDSTQWRDLW